MAKVCFKRGQRAGLKHAFGNAWTKTCFNGALPYHVKERSKDHGIIVTDHNYDAISSVADNLFVIADGYTNPVRCREDLVRHGYLRPEV